MATATTSTNNPAELSDAGSTASDIGGSTADAIELLTEDHRNVKALFDRYKELVRDDAEDDDKQQLAEQICMQLTAHATVEEEIFYPAARDVLGEEQDLIDEAEVEHGSAKELIAQIEESSPAEDDYFDAKVKVLGEQIEHHVKDEEGELFPKLRDTDLDLRSLGEEMAERKQALLAEFGADDASA